MHQFLYHVTNRRLFIGIIDGWHFYGSPTHPFKVKISIRICASAKESVRLTCFSPHSILDYIVKKELSFQFETAMFFLNTVLCVYSKPSTLNTGTINQLKFSAKSLTAVSSDVNNSFSNHVAVADVIHSRA